MIPLSYNHIDHGLLASVLARYQEAPHQQIVTDFEKALSKFLGVKYVIALNSGTSAIHLALRSLNVGAEDIILAPTFTYVATINPIIYQGAIPVFIDSEPNTWNISPTYLEEGIKQTFETGKKIKAIIIVHTYGMPCKWRHVKEIADRYRLPVIEDAAEAIGSKFEEKMAGTLGDIGVLSFNNNKILTTFGGGALITNNESTALKVRFLASQAREARGYYLHKEVGYNYLMGPLNAAYGLGQLPLLSQSIATRRDLMAKYSENISTATFQYEHDGHYSNRWLSAVRFDKKGVNHEVRQILADNNWETRPLWNPMHKQPIFSRFPYYGERVAEELFENGLCLPSGTDAHNPNNFTNIRDLVLKAAS